MARQQYYGRQKFGIKFTGDSIEARCHLPFGSKRNRILFSLFLILLAAGEIYWMWFSQDRFGHSNRWYLAHHYSAPHPGAAAIAIVFYPLFLLMGIRLLCPAGAILICN